MLRPMTFEDESKSFNSLIEFCLLQASERGEYSISDYEIYEKARERLFDSPVGRIAGRSGGTVARLWRKNVARYNERVKEVNKGPTEQALSHGVKVYCGPDKRFYNDYLSSALDSFMWTIWFSRW